MPRAALSSRGETAWLRLSRPMRKRAFIIHGYQGYPQEGVGFLG